MVYGRGIPQGPLFIRIGGRGTAPEIKLAPIILCRSPRVEREETKERRGAK